MAATHFSGPVISAAGFQTGESGAAGSHAVAIARRPGLADAAPIGIFTITVPNGIEAAAIFIDILAHLDNGESARCAQGVIVVARKAGVAAVAVAAALSNAAIATVAGGGTLTLAYAVSAAVGANNAAQTIAVSFTMTGTPAATHTLVAMAKVLNSADGGITIAAS